MYTYFQCYDKYNKQGQKHIELLYLYSKDYNIARANVF